MIVQRIQLHCDGERCSNHFPEDGALDAVIFTAMEVRKEAKAAKWRCDTVKTQFGAIRRDLCPVHARLHDQQMAGIKKGEN